MDASSKEFDNITLPYGEEGAPSFPSIPLPLAIAAAVIFLVGVGVYFIKGGKSREEPYPYEPQSEEI
ncbi:hypothetical protein AKJ48_04200 [candidate division MSBL1 archaeon SCGC-AAA261O19]|uniref:Uncharacterized protein n=1 Tax=candidate division MSBL1 archaeon SCGC-AAA261O19 TaxID=1698277 RepID=A0A133V9R7_9EURY|nr:hypothetical protein AKJ48_04200 [candidate division MSBL1 archaeon SCGC-AAA261O19]